MYGRMYVCYVCMSARCVCMYVRSVVVICFAMVCMHVFLFSKNVCMYVCMYV